MITIGILNAKGGVGKTTLTTTLAVRAAKDFRRTAIVDHDPQGGSTRWFDLRREDRFNVGDDDGFENPAILTGETDAAEAVEKLHQTGWDIAFFDGGPGSLEETEITIQCVDFVVIPLKASDQDTHSSEYVAGACMEYKKPYVFVINDANPTKGGDKRAKEVQEGFKLIKQPISEIMIHRRVAFVDAVNTGQTVTEITTGKQAAEEINKLYADIMNRIKEAQQ